MLLLWLLSPHTGQTHPPLPNTHKTFEKQIEFILFIDNCKIFFSCNSWILLELGYCYEAFHITQTVLVMITVVMKHVQYTAPGNSTTKISSIFTNAFRLYQTFTVCNSTLKIKKNKHRPTNIQYLVLDNTVF